VHQLYLSLFDMHDVNAMLGSFAFKEEFDEKQKELEAVACISCLEDGWRYA